MGLGLGLRGGSAVAGIGGQVAMFAIANGSTIDAELALEGDAERLGSDGLVVCALTYICGGDVTSVLGLRIAIGIGLRRTAHLGVPVAAGILVPLFIASNGWRIKSVNVHYLYAVILIKMF